MPDLASGWESDGQELSRRVQRSRAQRLSDPWLKMPSGRRINGLAETGPPSRLGYRKMSHGRGGLVWVPSRNSWRRKARDWRPLTGPSASIW